MTASSPLPKKLGIRIASPVKSTPPASKPTMGMTISLTRELTIAVNAPPTATPTARSTTEPRLINSINSLRKPEPLAWAFCKVDLALEVLVDLLSDVVIFPFYFDSEKLLKLLYNMDRLS